MERGRISGRDAGPGAERRGPAGPQAAGFFHSDNDDRAHVDESSVRQLPSIVNPANKKQRFLVLETWGHIYKGNYRMRLIYYPMQKECVLMGQEILELANL